MIRRQRSKKPRDLIAGKYDRHANRCPRPAQRVHPGQFGAHDPSVQIEQRGKSLPVRRGRNLLHGRQVSKELLDRRTSKPSRVLQLVKSNEAPHPVDVSLLGTKAVVIVANTLADLIQQPLPL